MVEEVVAEQSQVNEKVLNLVRDLASEGSFLARSGGEVLTFPSSSQSDFAFCLREEGGEIMLEAELHSSNIGEEFWYKWYGLLDQLPNFAENIESDLQHVLFHQTRILQERRIFLWDFTCEYQIENAWHQVGGMSYFRPSYRVPRIAEKKKIYYAFPRA